MARIQVLLDYPFPALYGEGWGMSKLAGGLRFAKRFAAYSSPLSGAHPSGLTPSGPPPGLWKVPGLGIITLEPRLFSLGPVDYEDPANDVWKPEEADISADDDGNPTALTIYRNTGVYARVRKSGPAALIGLLADAATSAILAELSSTLKVAWRTKAALKANEGWAIQVKPVRTPFDPRAKSYIAIGFGGKYQLGIDLQGVATLYENRGSAAAPVWIDRKRIDVGGGGVDLTKDFYVTCLPIGGRYLVLRFGNVRFKAVGFRLSSYVDQHDYVFDCIKEGEGNHYDADLDQFVVSPPGKLSIALNAAGLDYRFTPYKVRYDTGPVTATFTGEPLNERLPGQTPTLTPYGYAGGFTSGGGGTMTASFTDETGAAWIDDSLEVCPQVTFAASSDGLYTPELWYLEASIAPRVVVPPYTPYDASEEWTFIRFQRTAQFSAASCTIKFKDDSRYLQLMRRGGPIRILIDGVVVFDGYVKQRSAALGLTFVDAEYEGRDMVSRLSVPCGKFESQDGKGVADLLRKLIRRAGFFPENIVIHQTTLSSPPGDLLGMKVESFDEAESLKLYNWDCDVYDGIKDLIGKYSVQGYDRIRIRTIGDDWHVYLPWYGGEPTDPDNPDPELTFYSCSDDVLQGTDEERWDAGLLRITSNLEFDFSNPQFNALELYTASEGGDGFALKATVTPRASVFDDPDSQDFEGLLNPSMVSTATTANTEDELCREARFSYEVKQRECNKLGFQAEWQPFADVDMECVVVGRDPRNGDAVSFGVYRIEELDPEIERDDIGSGDTLVRHGLWSSSYTLQWLRPTSDAYALPMFSGFVPPPAYAGSVGGSA